MTTSFRSFRREEIREVYEVGGDLPTARKIVLEVIAEEGVEVCFPKAPEVTRRQSANLLELRATLNWRRLWHSQGSQDKKEAAH